MVGLGWWWVGGLGLKWAGAGLDDDLIRDVLVVDLLRVGLVRAGLVREGLVRAGLVSEGLVRTGLVRLGLVRAGFWKSSKERLGEGGPCGLRHRPCLGHRPRRRAIMAR